MEKISMTSSYALPLVALGFAFASTLNAETLLSETFVTGQRLTQNLTNTSAWYSSNNAAASDATGDLVVTGGNHVLSYLTDSGSPVQLSAVGDSLTASVTFSLSDPTANTTGFRIGLFDSGATRISADGAGLSNAAFEGDYGYAAFFNVNAATALRIYERDKAGEQLIHSGTTTTKLLDDTGTGITDFGTSDYTANITLLKTVSGVQITVAMSGYPAFTGTYEDTATLRTAFDMIAIYGSTSAMSGFTLKDVTISAIPEPSTTAMFLGCSALLLVACVKSSRSR